MGAGGSFRPRDARAQSSGPTKPPQTRHGRRYARSSAAAAARTTAAAGAPPILPSSQAAVSEAARRSLFLPSFPSIHSFSPIFLSHQSSPPSLLQSFTMAYGEIDQLAINTIRTLAVRLPLPLQLPLPLSPVPRHNLSTTLSPAPMPSMLTQIFTTGRCHRQGQLGSPGCAHGHGSRLPRPVQQIHEVQPQEPQVDQP